MRTCVSLHNLVRVGKTTHARHDTKDVVVGGVDANLGGITATDSVVRDNKLEGGVVDAREIAGARRLVLLRAKGERVDIDAGVRGAGVELVRLDEVEVGALALREAVLTVKLELGSDNRILAPAVHVKCGLSKDKGTSVRHARTIVRGTYHDRSRRFEYTARDDCNIIRWIISPGNGVRGGKCFNRIWERVNRVSVVERLSTVRLPKFIIAARAVVR